MTPRQYMVFRFAAGLSVIVTVSWLLLIVFLFIGRLQLGLQPLDELIFLPNLMIDSPDEVAFLRRAKYSLHVDHLRIFILACTFEHQWKALQYYFIMQYIPFRKRFELSERRQKFQMYDITKGLRPVIIEPAANSFLMPFENCRFEIHSTRNVNFLKAEVAKLLSKKNELREGFFLFVNKKLLANGEKTVAEIYEQHHDSDGFLYITFGEIDAF